MSEEILEKLLKKVENMESRLERASSLNGGFDKLLNEVAHIKESQTEVLSTVRGVKKSLYEPDRGLFSRVMQLEMESERRHEYIVETRPIVDEHKEVVLWKKRAEQELEDYEDLKVEFAEMKSWKSGVSRFMWLVGGLAASMWVKQILEFFAP
jgi:DNA repair exonuclease SbcCD ATPase subunit